MYLRVEKKVTDLAKNNSKVGMSKRAKKIEKKIMSKKIAFIFFISLSFSTASLIGFDQSRFFHAQYLPQEPRFSEENLTSPAIRLFMGKTHKKTDCCGAWEEHCPAREYLVQGVILDLYQNIYNGFFLGGTMPWYHFKINENDIEQKFTTSANFCLMGGWTYNYEECIELDFIDFTFETGFILPTGVYNIHAKGIPVRGACSLGIFDWITTGISADIVVFFDHQNGRLWDLSWYLKADHFFHGTSITFGYMHSNQHKTPIPWSEGYLPFWSMDTFNFELSYDAACLDHPFLPCLHFFYNHVLSGKNIVRAPQWGLGISCDF